MRFLLLSLPVLLLSASLVVAQSGTPAKRHTYPKPTGVADKTLQKPLASLRPDAIIPVPGAPDWIAVGDDVWVSNKPKDNVTRIDPQTAKVKQVLRGFNKPCSGLAIGFGSLWVPNCGDQTVTRVDLATGKSTTTFPMGIANSEGGIAVGAGSVWMMTDARSKLTRIDPQTNQAIATVTLPDGCYTPAFGFDRVWVTCTKQNTVVRVNPATNKIDATIPVGAEPRFLTTGEGGVWTLNQGDGTISRVDPKANTVAATIAAGLAGPGGDISAGNGAVWATLFGFPVTRIDPATNKITVQYVGEGGDALRAGGGMVWLSNYKSGTEWKIDPNKL